MAKVAVIIPAAGQGKRFGAKGNKVFERLHGEPVFLRTLEIFTSRDDVCQVLLVVSPDDREDLVERFGANLAFLSVEIIEGGRVRTESVRNALAAVSEEADLVAVHDAVRPCVAQEWVDAVFHKAAETGAAILACPVHGTVKKVGAGDVIEFTTEREGLWEAQTPQVFRKDILRAAYEKGEGATDDAALVEQAGHEVSVVPGDPRNVKITTPQDLAFAAAVLKTLPKPKPNGGFHPFDEGQW